MNESGRIKRIDMREVLKEKSPGVARILPGFVYRYIHRIMHIDYINRVLEQYGDLEGMEFVEAIIQDFNVEERVIGFEKVPAEGRFIFASNHPLGGFDALVLMSNISRKFHSMKFLTNDVLMNIRQLNPLFVPINKHGSYGREAAQALHKAYQSESQIVIFPSGLASRKIKGKVMDLEWQKHFISKALEYKRDIVPVFVEGRNSNRFYWIANLRKFFRINWNLEMFFLPDETFRHRNKTVTVHFGSPLPYRLFDRSKTHKEWAAYVKELVYRLPEQNQSTHSFF